MRRRLLILVGLVACLGLLSLSPSAQAGFTWLNTPQPGDELEIKYADYENLVPNQVGAQLFGVGYVSSIENVTTAQSAWQNLSTDGGQMTVIFKNYTLGEVLNEGTQLGLYFTGGNVTLYYDSTPEVLPPNPVQGTSAVPDADAGLPWSDGSVWLDLQGVGGLVQDNPATPLFDESTATLRALLDSLTGFGSNQGKGLLDVIGGTYGWLFDTNQGWSFNPTADMFLTSNLEDRTGRVPAGTYPVRSNDPLRGTAKNVPEPSSLIALLGMGLAALVVAARKR